MIDQVQCGDKVVAVSLLRLEVCEAGLFFLAEPIHRKVNVHGVEDPEVVHLHNMSMESPVTFRNRAGSVVSMTSCKRRSLKSETYMKAGIVAVRSFIFSLRSLSCFSTSFRSAPYFFVSLSLP